MLRKILPILSIFSLIQSPFLFAQTGVSDDLSELSIEEFSCDSSTCSVRFGCCYIFDFLTTTDNQYLANYPEDVTKILGDCASTKIFL